MFDTATKVSKSNPFLPNKPFPIPTIHHLLSMKRTYFIMHHPGWHIPISILSKISIDTSRHGPTFGADKAIPCSIGTHKELSMMKLSFLDHPIPFCHDSIEPNGRYKLLSTVVDNKTGSIFKTITFDHH